MIRLLNFLVAFIACLLTARGVWYLREGAEHTLSALGLVTLGGALLLLPPVKVKGVEDSNRPILLMVSCVLVAALILVLRDVQEAVLAVAHGLVSNPQQRKTVIHRWSVALVLIVVLGVVLDRIRNIKLEWGSRRDVLTAIGLTVSALVFRSLGPSTIAGDELMQTYDVLLLNRFLPLFTDVNGATFPFTFIYLTRALYDATGGSIDIIVLQKWMSFAAGSASVGLLFIFVRFFSCYSVALCAGLLCCFFSWHWVNSRFIYAYPLDLLNVMLASVACVTALRTRSALFAVLAGLSCVSALIIQKVGIVVIPFVFYLCLEHVLVDRRRRLVSAMITLVAIITVGLVAYEPFLVKFMARGGGFPRQAGALELRRSVLAEMGMTPVSAFLYMIKDVYYQLRIECIDMYRHVVRLGQPILDPIMFGLFSAGFIYSVITAIYSAASRIALTGFLIFIMPMILSFPVDHPTHGLARRMVCSSFFIVWMAALAAHFLASRLVGRSKALVLMLPVCLACSALNIYHALALPHLRPSEFMRFKGGEFRSMALIRFIRASSHQQLPTVVFELFEASVDDGVVDMPWVKRVTSASAVRNELLARKGELQLVVIPWTTRRFGGMGDQFVAEMADLIPEHLWVAGDPDLDGNPMFRYAYVRVSG